LNIFYEKTTARELRVFLETKPTCAESNHFYHDDYAE